MLDLGAELGYRSPRASYAGSIALLIVQEDGTRAALVVDQIDDQRQVVIKGASGQLTGTYQALLPQRSWATVRSHSFLTRPILSRRLGIKRTRSCASKGGIEDIGENDKSPLARQPRTAPAKWKLLSFRIGTHEYSVDIMSVREIRGWTRATSLPHAPYYVHGVINLRGTVLPVVDLGRRLGLEAEEPSERSVIIRSGSGGSYRRRRGSTQSPIILSISIEAMQPPPEMLNDGSERFVRGLIIIEDRMVRVLDLEAVLPPGTEAAA